VSARLARSGGASDIRGPVSANEAVQSIPKSPIIHLGRWAALRGLGIRWYVAYAASVCAVAASSVFAVMASVRLGFSMGGFAVAIAMGAGFGAFAGLLQWRVGESEFRRDHWEQRRRRPLRILAILAAVHVALILLYGLIAHFAFPKVPLREVARGVYLAAAFGCPILVGLTWAALERGYRRARTELGDA
jgi:hypothetical protein